LQAGGDGGDAAADDFAEVDAAGGDVAVDRTMSDEVVAARMLLSED
jgi:hypothetical protein